MVVRALCAACLALFFTGCGSEPGDSKSPVTLTTASGAVAFDFPGGWFESSKEGPFDLHCFSEFRQMTHGSLEWSVEDLAKDYTAEKLLENQIADLRSKRKNFETVSGPDLVTIAGKRIRSMLCAGEKGSSRYYYQFSSIEFTEPPGIVLIVLHVTHPSAWVRHRPIFEAVLRSARVVKN